MMKAVSKADVVALFVVIAVTAAGSAAEIYADAAAIVL